MAKGINIEHMDPVIYIVGFVIFIPLVGMLVGYLIQKLKSEERLRAIEKGVALPAEPVHVRDPWEYAAKFRVAGLVLTSVGVGLLILLASLAESLPEFPKGVIAVAAIPFLIGLAMFYEYRARSRELGPRPPVSPSRPSTGA